MAVLYWNDAFSILVLSTKKRYSSFLKKVFVFQKICFKIKAFKTFKISIDCHIKTCRSLKRRGIFENPKYCFLEESTFFLLALKWNFQDEAFSNVKTKINSNFAVKLVERSNHSFLLSIWWTTFFKHLYSLICDNKMFRT